MRVVYEELWKHPGFPGLVVVTTNATIRSNGALVMGCGAALQAKNRIPGVDFECGKAIRAATRPTIGYSPPRGEMAQDAYWDAVESEQDDQYCGVGYYFLEIRPPTADRVGFGVFQVKVHFRDRAELDLVYRSSAVLARYALRNPGTSIRMNYPAIGHGGLRSSEVEPLLECLPDNVVICRR